MGKWIDFSPWVCFQWALALLVLPLHWVLAVFSAALVHELGHVGMLLLLGVRIEGMSGDSWGMLIRTEPMPPGKELLCALAGPLASFALLLLIRWFPRVALCALVQGLYNMLPVLPFDGGRVLCCFLELVCPGCRDRLMESVRWITVFLVLLLGIWAKVRLKMGYWVVVLALFLIQKLLPRKRPCKDGWKRVQ